MASKQKVPVKTGSKQKIPVKSKARLFGDFLTRNQFAIALFFITFIVFGNGILNEYALDDEFYTNGGNKSTLKGFKGIPEIFKSRTFFNNDGSGYSYRPVTVASFAIENQFFGEKPHVSHFINVLLYAFIMVLLFNLLRKWFVTQGDWFSFFISLLFLVHPLHTEIVDNIKCRDELLAMLFTLSSIHLLWKYRETGNKMLLFLYPLLFWAAELSKTTVLPYYVLIPLALWFFTNDGWKKIAIYMIPLVLAGILTKLAMMHGLPPQSRTYKDFENPLWGHVSLMKHTATSFYIVGRYLLLHFIPYPLVYYYGYSYVDIVSWSNPIAIVSLLIHAALGLLALRELKKKSVLGFGLLFYLVNVAIFSNLVKPAPGLMAERFMFSASLGFSIIVIWAIFHFLKKDSAAFKWRSADSQMPLYIICGLVLIFTVRSVWRNEDWVSKEKLYGNDMRFLNSSAKANMLWGAWLSRDAMQANFEAHQSDGRGGEILNQAKKDESNAYFDSARIYYHQATVIAPYYHTAWSNLGTTYFFRDDPRAALPYFWKAVKLDTAYYDGWFNIGMAYDKLGLKDSAIYGLSTSIKCDSTYVQAYEQLARIRMQQEHNPQAALDLMHLAARHKPDSDVPWNDIAKFYLQMKDTAASAAAMEMAAKIDPTNIQRLINISEYFRVHKNGEKYNHYISLAQDEKRKRDKNKTDPPEEKTLGDSMEFPFIAMVLLLILVWRQRLS
jgi:tetratricopeptide (TPR) repeat protein